MTLHLLFDARGNSLGGRAGLTKLGQIGGAAVYTRGTAVGKANSAREQLSFGEADVRIFGWAFRRSDHARCGQLGEREEAELRESGAEWAARYLWGNYLLAWIAADGTTNIFRSPVTGPALYFTSHGASAFTNLELARCAGIVLDILDPQAIDAQLRYPLLRAAATGIDGIAELLAGEQLKLCSAPGVQSIWSPWDHVRQPPEPAETDKLRRIVLSVVSAWTKVFVRAQLELSGGLDSSIVAACLARTSADWRGVSLVTARPDGDERLYARAVADHLDISLIEIMAGEAASDPLAPHGCPRLRPGGFGLIGDSDRKLLLAAQDFGAEAVFTGVGGDNIFGYLTSAAPVVDALRFEGISAALRTASDLGRLTETNMLEALRFAARRILRPPPRWPRDSRFLSPQFDEEPRHPWFEGAERASDGQRAYVAMLMRILPFLDGYDRSMQLPMIAPLLSQPLVEYGLTVPAWQWSEGGHDRSLARRAFHADLPPIILQRRTKGRLESLFVPAYNENRSRIAAYLCDGLLADLGVIDCDAIAEAARRPASVLDTDYVRILQIADMERWARSVVGSEKLSQ